MKNQEKFRLSFEYFCEFYGKRSISHNTFKGIKRQGLLWRKGLTLCLLVPSADKQFGPDQAKQDVGSDLDPKKPVRHSIGIPVFVFFKFILKKQKNKHET